MTSRDDKRAREVRKNGTASGTGNGAGGRVACGEGALEITELQRPGGKRLDIAAFLAGTPIKPGDLLG